MRRFLLRRITLITKKYSVVEAAKALGISRASMYRYIEKGSITPRKSLGGKNFFTKDDIDYYKGVIENGIQVSKD